MTQKRKRATNTACVILALFPGPLPPPPPPPPQSPPAPPLILEEDTLAHVRSAHSKAGRCLRQRITRTNEAEASAAVVPAWAVRPCWRTTVSLLPRLPPPSPPPPPPPLLSPVVTALECAAAENELLVYRMILVRTPAMFTAEGSRPSREQSKTRFLASLP